MEPILVVMALAGGGLLAFFALYMVVMQNSRNQDLVMDDDPNAVWREIATQSTAWQHQPDIPRDVFTQTDVTLRDLEQETDYGGGGSMVLNIPNFPATSTPKAAGPGCGGMLRGLVFAVVFAVGGVAAGGAGYFFYTEWQDSDEWPTVQGTVTDTRIEESYDSEDSEYSYKPKITYEYLVDGETYEASRIDFRFFPKSYGTRSAAQNFINQLTTGARVTVYYNPNNPERAVLVREQEEWMLYGLMAGGGVLAILGLATFVFNLFRGFRSVLSPQVQPLPA